MQQCITRILVPVVPTEKGNLKYAYRQLWTDNSCCLQYYKQSISIAIMHTKVFICNCYIQKLSFAFVAYKRYCSFDAILRFFPFELGIDLKAKGAFIFCCLNLHIFHSR